VLRGRLFLKERAEKRMKGGFRVMVFFSGFAFPARGMKLMKAMDVNWIEIQVLSPSAHNPRKDIDWPLSSHPWAVVNDNARKAFYNGPPEAEIDEMMAGLGPMSAASAIMPIDLCVGDLKIPKTYVMTLLMGNFRYRCSRRFVAGTPI
jgi:hypothetical protein